MEKPILTSARGTYEPPYANIIEFAVEEGFADSGIDSDGFSTNDGTETVRYDVTGGEDWYY